MDADPNELGEQEPDDRDPILLERDPFVRAETPGRIAASRARSRIRPGTFVNW